VNDLLACFKKKYRKKIRHLLITDQALYQNPFNLMILCSLINEKGLKEHLTRTDLYRDLHNFLIEKAQERIDEDVLEKTVMILLYKVAYKAYTDGKRCYLTKSDYPTKELKKLCVSGFLYQKSRPSRRREVHFNFSHLTIVEYLSAQHLKRLGDEELDINCYIYPHLCTLN
jgi:hypothetical protein